MEANTLNSPDLVEDRETVPYLLKLKKVSRRFTSFIDENDQTIIKIWSWYI